MASKMLIFCAFVVCATSYPQYSQYNPYSMYGSTGYGSTNQGYGSSGMYNPYNAYSYGSYYNPYSFLNGYYGSGGYNGLTFSGKK